MRKFICSICGYTYDEAAGEPSKGISPGTLWEDIAEDWSCPLCGAMKSDFEEEKVQSVPVSQDPTPLKQDISNVEGFTYKEISALCSNFGKGCEKQYRMELAELFKQLEAFYRNQNVGAEKERSVTEFQDILNKNLKAYEQDSMLAVAVADRGAMRALVWGEKVTKSLKSLLNRYEKQQAEFLETTHLYVCEVCGFAYVGEEKPEVCPVCKVSNKKIAVV